jgi:replicative DNA helicase
MSNLKMPPANIEAEQSLLSAILMNQDTLGDVMRQLKADDFYDVRHQKIYETAVSMYQAGRSDHHRRRPPRQGCPSSYRPR